MLLRCKTQAFLSRTLKAVLDLTNGKFLAMCLLVPTLFTMSLMGKKLTINQFRFKLTSVRNLVASLILLNSRSLLVVLLVAVLKDNSTQNPHQPTEPLIALPLDPMFAQTLVLPLLPLQTQLPTLVLNHLHNLLLAHLLPCLTLSTVCLNSKYRNKDSKLKMKPRLSIKRHTFTL